MFSSLKKHLSSGTIQDLPEIDQNLVDIGGDLSVPYLLRSYRRGSFPWTVHPVTWWSPDPRAVMEFNNFHLPKSLRRVINQKPFEITIDRAFERVIRACAAPARGRRSTWITPEFLTAYTQMHKQGYAHSLECWQSDELVGGIYGIAIGGYFAGESMFHRVDNASKVALYYLVQHLRGRGYALLDVQMPTHITLQLGATLISRKVFLQRQQAALQLPVSFGVELAA
jgi:leucyl/phenylalanyl-tRNA---protein transferase